MDVVTIQLMMRQIYELAVRGILKNAKNHLSDDEKATLMNMRGKEVNVTAIAETLSGMFSSGNLTSWHETIRDIGDRLDKYEHTIAGLILVVSVALEGDCFFSSNGFFIDP